MQSACIQTVLAFFVKLMWILDDNIVIHTRSPYETEAQDVLHGAVAQSNAVFLGLWNECSDSNGQSSNFINAKTIIALPSGISINEKKITLNKFTYKKERQQSSKNNPLCL
jgi:hypothetical protein